MVKNKNGISLIVLIITIAVVIILASIIIMTFKNTNPTGKANEVKFKSDVRGFRDELMLTFSDKEMENPDFVKENVNVNLGNFVGMKQYIPDITEEYSKKLFIKNGQLLYIGDDANENYNKDEEKWAQEQGVQSPYGRIGDANGDGYITQDDAILIQQEIVNIKDLTDRQKLACDTNCDGQITIADAMMIQKYTAGIITEIVCPE